MRDTSDMMEDALSEDTVMECEGDGGGLEELVDLSTDVADSSTTIRDAAERLLTLLGVGEDGEELLSSSEDEGVELDELEDELEDDEEDAEENSRLLHQLAASLAKELKQSHQQAKQNPSRLPTTVRDHRMDATYLSTDHGTSCLQEQTGRAVSCYRDAADKCQRQDILESSCQRLEGRPRTGRLTEEGDRVPATWSAGWDACAAEALRYLLEDEGLPAHHPTVLAMKDHLELQRERAFARYAT